MLELCISGQVFRIFFLSSLAQIIKAFIGRLMCGCPSAPFATAPSGLLRPRDSRTMRGPLDRRGVPSSSLGPGDEGEEEEVGERADRGRQVERLVE